MDKNGVLTISNWTKGMADSAYQGFSSISNCEVFETPGVLKIANATSAKNGTSHTGMPIAYVEDAYGNYYYLTNDGKFYRNGTLLQSGLTNAWDMVIYNDYVIISNSTVLQAYGPLNPTLGSPLWTGNWKTGLNGLYYGKLVPAKDGNLYIGNGESVAKISSFSAGTSTTAPTATFNLSSMLLPAGNAITTMAEVGIYIMIGTQALNGSYFNGVNGTVANLYLWDKSDTKPTSLCGSLAEASIQAMFSYANRLYVMAGVRGNLYVTDTSSFTKIKRIPWNQNRLFGATLRVYPNAMSLNIQGNLLVGTSTLTDSYGASASAVRHGVYEIKLSEGYPTVFKQQISTGNVGQTQPLRIGVVFAGNGVTIIGWQDGSSYGLDTNGYTLYNSGVATVESELFNVGTRLNRKIFQNLEFLLGKPLTTGQQIIVSGRHNLTEDYTVLGTYTYTDLGAVISHNAKALLDELEVVQIKIQLVPNTSSANNSIELIKVIIW